MNDTVSLDPDSLAAAHDAYETTVVSDLERRLYGEIGPRLQAEGHAVKDDLDDTCRWRAQRASGFVARNDPAEVVEITRLAFSAGVTDRVRLKLLTLLDGMAERTASILLSMWAPERFVPWDEAAAGVLVTAGLLEDATLPANWPAYLAAVAELASTAAMTPREVEKALYILGGGEGRSGGASGGDGGGRRTRTVGVSVDPALVGDPDDEAGAALVSQLAVHRAGVRDFESTKAKARETLAVTTPPQRRLLLRLHTRLSEQLFPKASRDLGWLYYANEVGSGLVGEVALRVPRGIHEVRLVAYLPVAVQTGDLRQWFEPSSATQKKAQIPPDEVDVDGLCTAFEAARRWVLTR